MKVDNVEFDTIVDGGRTHFAIDGDYAGSINTYNNAITKFGAWLGGKAITITVNGEKLYANCNSLRKFLLKNDVEFRSIEEFTYRDLSSYQFKVLPFYGKQRFMSAHISAATRNILSKDLFKAISLGDQGLALKKIRQGAELDTHAWFNEDSGQFFFREYFAPALPSRPLNPQRFTQATPLLLATRLNQVAVATLIKQHEADTTLVGQTLVFTRDLIYTSQTNVYLDRYDDRNLMTFNPYDHQIDYTPQSSIYTQWDTNHPTAIIPVW